mmetsp:Transcript_14481/g.20426  ORF Transcript_14481/g.20426 Transcript_14481/m.20426 type:complete len:231 (-) Transcript_14481:164-856(-)
MIAIAILLNVFWISTAVANKEVSLKQRGFSWSASLHRPTGIATSVEKSHVLKGSPLDLSLSRVKPKQQLESIRNHFESYPCWLGRPAVSFGLLRTVQDERKQTTWIKDVLFGINLLSFGRPRRELQIDQDRQSKRLVVTLPVQGGLLALKSKNKKDTDLGCLLFSLVQKSERDFFIETGISGYRPTIAGGPPVSRFRKWTYWLTQSHVHAYVMWRFHNYCRRSDITKELK